MSKDPCDILHAEIARLERVEALLKRVAKDSREKNRELHRLFGSFRLNRLLKTYLRQGEQNADLKEKNQRLRERKAALLAESRELKKRNVELGKENKVLRLLVEDYQQRFDGLTKK